MAGPLARSYAYDAAGNVTGDGVNGFLIDRSGRLSQATGPWGQATYRFDGLGRRVGKTRSGGGAETYYVYDDAGHLIGEYSATGQALQETVWLGDTPVAVLKAGVLYYVHADHLDAPRVITDSQNRVVWRWDNADAFGVGSPNENPSGLGIFTYNLRFPGQFFDQETGLHYNYFRDSYDPRGGRYLQADPIGLDGGINPYVYVENNPISNVDPEGLMGRAGGRGTPNYPNGNWKPGHEKQDMVCTPPGDRLDVNKCTKQCCVEHDLCYMKHQCNASSWQGSFTPAYSKYACQQCNQEAAACFAKAAAKPSCYEKDQCK